MAGGTDGITAGGPAAEDPAAAEGRGVTVYATAPDEETARRLARLAVERRLAACANAFPVASTYRWEGKLVEEGEFALLFKTTRQRFDALGALVAEVTGYQVPCAVAWPWDASLPAYAKWVAEETR